MPLPSLRSCLHFVLAMLFLVIAKTAAGAATSVRFAVGETADDARFDFAARLLETALDRSGKERQVVRIAGMNQPRGMEALRSGRIDVMILPNIRAQELGLKAIPFPIRRGLLGVRLLLSRPEDADRLARVESLPELKQRFSLGYGHAWLDRKEMADLGFRIETATTYAGLFDMLRAGRFDYLSRGVNELPAELKNPRLAGNGLVVVPEIAMFYPLDDFFFVKAGRNELKRDIERGLEAMLEDGSYDRMLEAEFGEAMRAAAINKRSVLHVLGYPVPEGTPLERFDILSPVRSQAIFRDVTPTH